LVIAAAISAETDGAALRARLEILYFLKDKAEILKQLRLFEPIRKSYKPTNMLG